MTRISKNHWLYTMNIAHRGFHNATIEEVAAATGLSGKALKNAMHREFTIPLFQDKKTEEILQQEVVHQRLHILYGGRFMHLVSSGDKGGALKLIMSGYKQKYQTDQIRSVAIGDSLNDFTMLCSKPLSSVPSTSIIRSYVPSTTLVGSSISTSKSSLSPASRSSS